MEIVGDDLDLLGHLHHPVNGLPEPFTAGAFVHVIYGIARFSHATVITEVGVGDGSTTTFLVQAAMLNGGHCWGIDRNGGCEAPVFQRMQRMNPELLSHWTFVEAFSEGVAKRWDHGLIDLLYIDGGHDRHTVEQDLRAWLPLVGPTGIVLMHDYGNEAEQGVREAADSFLAECGAGWCAFALEYDVGLLLLQRVPRAEGCNP